MINIDSLFTVAQILERLTTPEDVFVYLSMYRKKYAEIYHLNEEPWIIYSSGGCYIGANPSTPGWRPLRSCLGCQLVCRMTHNSHFPELNKNITVGGNGALKHLMFKVQRIDQSKRDKVVNWYMNSAVLDQILKPLGTRTTALFVYECNGYIIKIDEIPGIGFGFSGLRTLRDFNRDKLRQLQELARKIDKEMKKNKYKLKNYGEDFLAFEKSETGINIRISAHSEDTISANNEYDNSIEKVMLQYSE